MNSNVIEMTVQSGLSGPPVRVVEVLIPRGGTTTAGAAEARERPSRPGTGSWRRLRARRSAGRGKRRAEIGSLRSR